MMAEMFHTSILLHLLPQWASQYRAHRTQGFDPQSLLLHLLLSCPVLQSPSKSLSLLCVLLLSVISQHLSDMLPSLNKGVIS